MTDADFQAKLERGLVWAGLWQSPQHEHPIKDAHETNWQGQQMYVCETCVEVLHVPPCPPLTDELVFKLVRSLTKRGITVVFYRDGEVALSQGVAVCIRHAAGDNDPARAIVLAVAALAEQEK